jgi:putative ABC transport system permease protein
MRYLSGRIRWFSNGATMLAPRWRKVIRDLLENRTRTALVVLSIAVGVFAFGAVGSSRVVLLRELDREYAASNPASITMLLATPFDDSLTAAVEGMREVSQAEARGRVIVDLKIAPDEWIYLELYALESFTDQQIALVQPDAGTWPPQSREIVLERSIRMIPGVQFDDTISIETGDGVVREVGLAGYAYDIAQFPSSYYQQAYGYITPQTYEYLTGSQRYNQLLIEVAGDRMDRNAIEETATTIRERIEREGYVVIETTIPEPGKHWNSDGMQAIIAVLWVLGGASLLFSGFLVTNTVSALLTHQKRQIGVMKTIGAEVSDVMGIYVAIVLVFGVLAFFIAFPLGIVGARLYVDFVAALINLDINSYATDPSIYLVQAAVALLMPLLAALSPILQGTSVTIREAITDYGIGGRSRMTFIDRMLERLRGLPRPFVLSLRNTIRRKGRLTLTMGTLIMAGAMFVGLLSMRLGLLGSLQESFNLFQYEVGVVLRDYQRTRSLEREVARVDNIESFEVWSTGVGQYLRPDDSAGVSIPLFAVPIGTDYVDAPMVEGRWFVPGDERAVVVTGDFTAVEPTVSVGDTITFKVGEREDEWTVVGIAKPLGDPTSNGLGYVPLEAYNQLQGRVGQGNYIAFRAENPSLTGQVTTLRGVEDHFEQVGLTIDQSLTMGQFEAGATTAMNILIVLTLIMAFLMAVVGGLGLMGTMSLNVIERTREIGVIRAIGASNRAVWGIIVVEGMLIGAVSAMIGTVASIPITLVLSQAIGTIILGAPLDFAFSWPGVAIWFGISCLIAAAACFLPARRAVRMSVRETLAYE